MSITKRKLLLIIISCLLVFTSACGAVPATTTPAGTTQPAVATTEATTAEKTGEPTPATTAEATAAPTPTPADPFGKSDETIIVTTGTSSLGFEKNLPKPDTIEDNEFSRYFLDTLNTKVKYDFIVDGSEAYNQKCKLAIASSSMPDYLNIYDESIFRLALKSGMIEDLTPYYEEYASPQVKEFYASAPGNKTLLNTTFNGKLMALTNNMPTADMYQFCWIRKDWLDQLGLAPPTTLDDVINIALMFKEKDPGKNGNVGLAGNKDLTAVSSSMFNFDLVFSLYDSYPKQWIANSSGQVQYGSIAPETKTALAKLADMYQKGVIDKEFAVRKDFTEVITSNKSGIHFSCWWISYWPMNDSYVNSKETANWVPYIVPLNAQGKVNKVTNPPCDRWLVVKKGFVHPEAIVRMYNLYTRIDTASDPMTDKFYAGIDDPNAKNSRAFSPLFPNLSRADLEQRRYAALKSVVDGKTDISSLTTGDQDTYKTIKEYMDGDKTMGKWATYTAQYAAASLFDDQRWNIVNGAFYGITKTMESKWATLQKLEQESMLAIIMGEKDISYFDEFVSRWKALGGDEITTEVQTDVDSRK